MKKTKIIALMLIAALLVVPFASCADGSGTPGTSDSTDKQTENDSSKEEIPLKIDLADTDISEYTVVYSESGLDFNIHAAGYIAEEIYRLSPGTTVKIGLDTETPETENEIVIGKTNRSISADAENADLKDMEYLIERSGKKVLLYGEEYMVAAAARRLVNELSHGKDIPEEKQVLTAEFEDPKNIIYIIGDGMGLNGLYYGKELYESNIYISYDFPLPETGGYSQEEIIPLTFPNQGQVYTHSADNDVTDGAASGTALATGYKTYNGVIGLDTELKPVKNLVELAIEKGKKTAVITTNEKYSATAAAFTAHTLDRDDGDIILWHQDTSGCDLIYWRLREPAMKLWDQLNEVTDEENGFFMMYEEGDFSRGVRDNYTGVYCIAYMRFNTSLRIFLEYAMYHPDTAIIIAANHESGDIEYSEDLGGYQFMKDSRTGKNAPLLGIGKGTKEINGATFDNTGVAKLVAKLMGEDNFGDQSIPVTTENTGEETIPEEELEALAAKFKELSKAYKDEKIANAPKIS